MSHPSYLIEDLWKRQDLHLHAMINASYADDYILFIGNPEPKPDLFCERYVAGNKELLQMIVVIKRIIYKYFPEWWYPCIWFTDCCDAKRVIYCKKPLDMELSWECLDELQDFASSHNYYVF